MGGRYAPSCVWAHGVRPGRIPSALTRLCTATRRAPRADSIHPYAVLYSHTACASDGFHPPLRGFVLSHGMHPPVYGRMVCAPGGFHPPLRGFVQPHGVRPGRIPSALTRLCTATRRAPRVDSIRPYVALYCRTVCTLLCMGAWYAPRLDSIRPYAVCINAWFTPSCVWAHGMRPAWIPSALTRFCTATRRAPQADSICPYAALYSHTVYALFPLAIFSTY
jgi:hypothetical protein